MAPHKLEMAARMSDAAASKYLSRIADDLRAEGLDVEPISTGIPAVEIDKFIEKNDIDLIVLLTGVRGCVNDLSGASPGCRCSSGVNMYLRSDTTCAA